jgi:hypothetical protein
MKIIKHPDTYQCEICLTEYDTEDKALACEASPSLPECSIKVGDEIEVAGKWDTYKVKAKAVTIGKSAYDPNNRLGESTHEWEIEIDQQIEMARGSWSTVVTLMAVVGTDEYKRWRSF